VSLDYALSERCGKMADGSDVGYALWLSTKPAEFERE